MAADIRVVLWLTLRSEEFHTFVNRTEDALRSLFRSIDHDKNGKLDKTELRDAFARAGLAIPKARLDDFFSRVDSNNDGAISFDEWRWVTVCLERWLS